MMSKPDAKKNWAMSSSAFYGLLRWLDEGVDSEGQNFLEMRRRLIAFFDRKNCRNADELADETLNRVARRLEEEGKIESETPAKYCYITARFVFMESLREKEKDGVPLDEVLHRDGGQLTADDTDEKQRREKMLDCLEHCTKKLEPENREIIIRYYYGEERVKIENRRALAASLNISVNALSIRACRIRDKLENCVGKCAEN